MPGDFQFQMNGASDLRKALNKLPEGMGDKICAAALRGGAKIIREEIKNAAPVGTKSYTGVRQEKRTRLKNTKQGQVTELLHLRDQIKVTAARTKNLLTSLKVYTGKAFWGQFLEFGTSKMAAIPFFRPAFERTKIAALQEIGNKLGKGIEDRARKLAGPLAKSGLLKKYRG